MFDPLSSNIFLVSPAIVIKQFIYKASLQTKRHRIGNDRWENEWDLAKFCRLYLSSVISFNPLAVPNAPERSIFKSTVPGSETLYLNALKDTVSTLSAEVQTY